MRVLREILGRLLLVLGGLLAGLVILEAVLQTAAAVIRAGDRRPSPSVGGGRRRILSLGDSNTYGLYLEPADAYPMQLQRLWSARHGEAPIEVVNLGYPGNNSSQILRHLTETLEAVRPDVVTVMIGANDFWTEPAPLGEEQATVGGTLWRVSRVYRLLYMLRRSGLTSGVSIDVEPEEASGSVRRTVRYGALEFTEVRAARKAAVDDWDEALAWNLRAIAAQAGEAHVDLVFLTYPSPHHSYEVVDRLIRRVVRDAGAPLVDVASRMRMLCPSPPCPGLLFTDQHPTAAGSAVAAEMIEAWLAERWQLTRRGGEDARGPARSFTATAVRPRPAPR